MASICLRSDRRTDQQMLWSTPKTTWLHKDMYALQHALFPPLLMCKVAKVPHTARSIRLPRCSDVSASFLPHRLMLNMCSSCLLWVESRHSLLRKRKGPALPSKHRALLNPAPLRRETYLVMFATTP